MSTFRPIYSRPPPQTLRDGPLKVTIATHITQTLPPLASLVSALFRIQALTPAALESATPKMAAMCWLRLCLVAPWLITIGVVLQYTKLVTGMVSYIRLKGSRVRKTMLVITLQTHRSSRCPLMGALLRRIHARIALAWTTYIISWTIHLMTVMLPLHLISWRECETCGSPWEKENNTWPGTNSDYLFSSTQ
jgi:hypothetical protein